MKKISAMELTRSTPTAAEGRFQNIVGAGQRAGVRGGGLGGGSRASGLDDDDRLGERDLARGREERTGVADRLHVDDDGMGARIAAEVVDQIAPVHVQHRADGDEAAEADILTHRPVQHRGAQGAALADEGHVAGPRHRVGKGRIQAENRVHHAQAVGADDAHPAMDDLA